MSNFAPVGNSNVVLLGDVPIGGRMSLEQEFIVNATTAPGAYPLKISFVYANSKGIRLVDDQVITLLVSRCLNSSSASTNPWKAWSTRVRWEACRSRSQPFRKSVVLGNVVVTSPDGEMSNNNMLVGTLDPAVTSPLTLCSCPLTRAMRSSTSRFAIRTISTNCEL